MENMTIGSDPEFLIMNDRGIRLSASEIFSPMRYKTCGISPADCSRNRCMVHGRNPFCTGTIGADCGAGELRPEHSDNPLGHFDNIKKMIKLLDFDSNIMTRAGTAPEYISESSKNKYRFALGGHIHLGHSSISGMRYDNNDQSPLKPMSRYLSYYAGIPMKKVEYDNELMLRGLDRGNYGWFGVHHLESYGIQWRMPASWLVSEDMAKASLCLTYVVANEWLTKPEPVEITDDIYMSLVKGNISDIVSKVEKMELYSLYQSEIEPLFQLIINGEKWEANRNITEMW